MPIMLNRLTLTMEKIGTEAGDKWMDDWYTPGLTFRVSSSQVYLASIHGYRSFERDDTFPEVAARLRPDYNETLDVFIKRMTAPHGGANTTPSTRSGALAAGKTTRCG